MGVSPYRYRTLQMHHKTIQSEKFMRTVDSDSVILHPSIPQDHVTNAFVNCDATNAFANNCRRVSSNKSTQLQLQMANPSYLGPRVFR